jgi:hypothetical protein
MWPSARTDIIFDLESLKIPVLQSSPTDQGAAQGEEGRMDVSATIMANSKASELDVSSISVR